MSIYNNVFDSVKFYNSSDNKGKIEIFGDFPLADYSTFKIGGKADIAMFPDSEDALVFCLGLLSKKNIKTYVIGNGSNVLFSDEGIRGAVVFTSRLGEIKVEGTKIHAMCGAGITKVARVAEENSLSGLEFAFGIPGSCGGALYMNAGAYGGQISDVVEESTYFDVKSGKLGKYTADEHKFDYRKSVYMENGNKIILSTVLNLREGNRDEIKSVMDTNLKSRKDKQPLEWPSAGSTFKRYPGYYTGKIIEEAGLKGKSIGGAEVSEKHAGFIINRGNATAADVKALVSFIKETIYEKHGIMLECEIRFID